MSEFLLDRGGRRRSPTTLPEFQEALALTEADLDQRRGSLLVRRGKGGRRREVGMDAWGWEELQPWLELRRELPQPVMFVTKSVAPIAATARDE